MKLKLKPALLPREYSHAHKLGHMQTEEMIHLYDENTKLRKQVKKQAERMLTLNSNRIKGMLSTCRTKKKPNSPYSSLNQTLILLSAFSSTHPQP